MRLLKYRDWYSCLRAAGKPIPSVLRFMGQLLDGASARFMQTIYEGGAAWGETPQQTRSEALRLAIGRMMSHIVEKLERPDGTLYLYSGHDWTVSPLLLCLVLPSEELLDEWPPFCSNLAIELWSSRCEQLT